MENSWIQGKSIEKPFAQINDAYEYGIFAGHTLSEADMVQTGEILILNHGNYATKYKEWHALPEANQTWDEFMTFWQRTYNLKSKTETTAASLNFSAHMENVGHEGDTIDKAVSNLGEAFAAKSTVISQLTETNSTLHDHLNRNITDLQHQMASMNMAMQNLAVTGCGNTSTQNQRPIPLLEAQAAQAHQAPTQASQSHQAPHWKNPTFVQQQPPPIPPFPPTQQRGGGRNFRGRRRGGRGGGTCERKYCWTHGLCAHNGREYRSPMQGHQSEATRENRMNGNDNGCSA